MFTSRCVSRRELQDLHRTDDRRETVRQEITTAVATATDRHVHRETAHTEIITEKAGIIITVTITVTDRDAAITEERDQMAIIRDLTRMQDRVRISTRVIVTAIETIRIAAKNLIPEDWIVKLTSLTRIPHRSRRRSAVRRQGRGNATIRTATANSAATTMYSAARNRNVS